MRRFTMSAAIGVLALGAMPAAQSPSTVSLLPPGETGTPLHVEGRIVGPAGPAAGVALNVYQTDRRGYYSSEANDDNTKPRLKARFPTDAQGRFVFDTIMPGQYPKSGPPAHIHLEVTPAGQRMQGYELVFEGDNRLTDAIRADAKAEKFYAICAPTTGAGGVKQCRDVTFRLR
jgi:protocatechuate 3,4-dioxygenase beta subunit